MNVTQNLGQARLEHTLASLDNTTVVTGQTIAGENGTNAVLTTVTCTQTNGQDCQVTLTLRDCCRNNGGFPERYGGSKSGIFFRKENLHSATNPAYSGSCDANVLYYNVERSFQVDSSSGALSMVNGSCLWVLDPDNATHSAITTGSCDQPQGKFVMQHNGTIVWAGAAQGASLCLTSSVSLAPCSSSSTTWTISTNASMPGYLYPASSSASVGDGGSNCVMVVPDNSNNTVSTAAMVFERDSGAVVTAAKDPAPVNSSAIDQGIAYTVSLKSGVTYVVVSAVLTLRDIGCAGTRPNTEKCPQPIEEAAMAHATSLGQPGRLAAAQAAHDAFWLKYWNASSIDITNGNGNPNATVMEKW